MQKSIRLAVVAFAVLYLSAALALTLPEDEPEGFEALSYNRPRQNGSDFVNCTSGERTLGPLCSSNQSLTGAGRNQIVIYEVIVLRSRPNGTEPGRQHRRSVTCCQFLGYDLRGNETMSSRECGLRRFGGVAYWGNVTGNPGVRCLGFPNATQISWRYFPVTLRSDKYDVGGEYFSDF